MPERRSEIHRQTRETDIRIALNLDGTGIHEISTGIPFFDHMLTLFSVHGFFDLNLVASGDIEIDYHHTVEDVGLVLGTALDDALGGREGIRRYGDALTPMDETLASVAIDLSKRPYLVYHLPDDGAIRCRGAFDAYLAREFFQAFSVKGLLNLHINVLYGENEHHIIEAVFKALGRALDTASSFDRRIKGVRSSKAVL